MRREILTQILSTVFKPTITITLKDVENGLRQITRHDPILAERRVGAR